jgi:hypothetical protein
MEEKNKTKEGLKNVEELCCADKNVCDIRCAPKKGESKSKKKESGCGCGGCCGCK